jgi:hypothetical protein
MHGIFFMTYAVAAIVFAPSQGWSRRRTLIAGLASVPPYGSLLFEQWAAYQRRRLRLHHTTMLLTYSRLTEPT